MKKYYLGLDVGTDSVGYAVTDQEYSLLKFRGEPMWGTTIFNSANQNAERRMARTTRRRISRKKARVQLLQELFAEEIYKIDPKFFIRLKESRLYGEDTTDKYSIFNDVNYTDKNYHEEYPTIHHLIVDLMQSDEPQDVRLIYLACAWLVSHRGHFLNEIDKNNIAKIKEFKGVYNSFEKYIINLGYSMPWDCNDIDQIGNILKKKITISQKYQELTSLLFGKKPVENFDAFPFSKEYILKLLSGGTVELKKLYNNEEYENLNQSSISFSMKDEDLESVFGELGEDAELLIHLKTMYDWAILVDILAGEISISKTKIAIYNKHKQDLSDLKMLIKKYLPSKYKEIFKDERPDNYTAYSYNAKNCSGQINFKKADKETFSKYILKYVKQITPEQLDIEVYNRIISELNLGIFLPKQVNTDNRVIPYQLYYYELNTILEKASFYLPFLSEKDENGLSVKDKILSIFEFRIPYFVGPLCKKNNNDAWIVRKAGKIYPWNFEKMVDQDASEQAFIRRMTNFCTYIPGETVLPKYSLLYSAFTVLNEINNLKIDGNKISVELKQKIYNELFMTKVKITTKTIINYLIANNYIEKNEKERVTGIDVTVKSSLHPFMSLKKVKENYNLTEESLEGIIARITYSQDKKRLQKWLTENHPNIFEVDIRYICGLKFNDFGRFSKKFLNGFVGVDKETGECFTIIGAMWNQNYNLMELLSDRFTFREELEKIQSIYYAEKPISLTDRLNQMWISNSVRRPIYRALDIVKEIVKTKGYPPTKIFIEMARDASDEKKGQRSKTRYQQICELYNQIKTKEVHDLKNSLEQMGEKVNAKLQSDKLFLYYMQLGKCMYSGEPIDLVKLMDENEAYNIDHIYPQCYIKDDSIWNNKVLVKSEINGTKQDIYPIDVKIQMKMRSTWDYMKSVGLLTDEKYKRLIRNWGFSPEEKLGFINRQLVETRQSTKALATILKEKYNDTEIVYVKAGLVSEFRHAFDLVKVRSVNDLHHAKDAYLNIVVGNVYDEKFSKRWFKIEQPYSLKVKTIFTRPLILGERTVWKGKESISNVKKTLSKNAIHFTKLAFCKQGALFDLMPVKKGANLVALKKGLDTEKYGGYNKSSASYFVLVKYKTGVKNDVIFLPIDLMYSKQFEKDDLFAMQYIKEQIYKIFGKTADKVELPFGKRKVKIGTMISLDGFKACITGKSGGAKRIILMPMNPLLLAPQWEEYIKKIDSYVNKLSKFNSLKIDEKYDKLSKEQNEQLYDILMNKIKTFPYSKRPNTPIEILEKGKEKFKKLSVEDQTSSLTKILQIFGRVSNGCNLTLIGGSVYTGETKVSSSLSNLKKKFQNIRIIDQSTAGLYKTESINLLELL